MFEYIVRLVGRKPGLENVIEWDWRNMLNFMRRQADVSVIQTLVTDLNHACSQGKSNFTLVNFLLSWAVFTRVSVGVYTRKIFT